MTAHAAPRWMEQMTGKHKAVAVAGVGLALAGQALRRRRAIELWDTVVLITGSSRGLGLALAREFAQEGAHLVICARNGAQLLEAERELADYGVDVLAIPCDVTDRAQVDRMVAIATERFGRIDILVNNAGSIAVGPIDVQEVDDFRVALDSMFWGTVYPTFAVLPQMRVRGEGRIVNITSIGGRVSVPFLMPYNCAKHAAVAFSEGLRAELAKDGITVVTVVPGLMRTGSYLNALYKGQHAQLYSLFSVLANSPVTSMDAGRAARQIVQATRRGDAEFVVTSQAKLMERIHGLAPGVFADVLGLVNRLLPQGGSREARLGRDCETAVSESFLTALGRGAAREFHQPPYGAADAPGAEDIELSRS
jgi:NAD(P)-dependent dehydrogenase (short-subunit alcohol dehydrogenase family)